MTTLPCAYLPPVHWFAALLHGDDVRVEMHDSYQKQTYRSRCHIASPTGMQVLNMPVAHTVAPNDSGDAHSGNGDTPVGHGPLISEQGAWRHLHLQALRSAYQMTPYYDYYVDELEAFYTPGRYPCLYDFNMALAQWMAQQMSIDRPIPVTDSYQPGVMLDIHPKHQPQGEPRPYYQVFAQRTGFIPWLSGIDLLMNMGPESIFYL